MRAEFLLIPVASLAIISPVHATVYLSVEQAQKLLFPGAAFTADFRVLTRGQEKAVEKASGVNVRNSNLRIWRISTGGWFIVDDVTAA